MNSKLISSLTPLLAQFDDAATPNEVRDRLLAALRPFGCHHLLITGLPLPQDGPWYRRVLCDGWPSAWFRHYTSSGHFFHDPCAQQSRYAAHPFFWSELPKAEMTPHARRVMDEAGEFGLRDGLCVPIHVPFQMSAVVTAAGEHVDTLRRNLPVLETLCVSAFRALRRLNAQDEIAPQQRLSAREREVLSWAAAGKAAEDIACILAISRFTVDRHLSNVREKLGSTNTVHAVVEAVRRGEIRP